MAVASKVKAKRRFLLVLLSIANKYYVASTLKRNYGK
jgi:hypothetical protein